MSDIENIRLRHDFAFWVNKKCHIFWNPWSKYIITKKHKEAIEMIQDHDFIELMAYRWWGKSELIDFLW